ncbi:hypothetical protein QR98_0076910 [Sarcoptes scabiei]|uniref:Uncharacterized protein n=1 Tax=Sarcoptes scabiei TaxID=52283 RepID=A0A132ADT9_SARSC|nr:hypothetical protein QR98_0076910 [Sarcoptes scabiei]
MLIDKDYADRSDLICSNSSATKEEKRKYDAIFMKMMQDRMRNFDVLMSPIWFPLDKSMDWI